MFGTSDINRLSLELASSDRCFHILRRTLPLPRSVFCSGSSDCCWYRSSSGNNSDLFLICLLLISPHLYHLFLHLSFFFPHLSVVLPMTNNDCSWPGLQKPARQHLFGPAAARLARIYVCLRCKLLCAYHIRHRSKEMLSCFLQRVLIRK